MRRFSARFSFRGQLLRRAAEVHNRREGLIRLVLLHAQRQLAADPALGQVHPLPQVDQKGLGLLRETRMKPTKKVPKHNLNQPKQQKHNLHQPQTDLNQPNQKEKEKRPKSPWSTKLRPALLCRLCIQAPMYPGHVDLGPASQVRSKPTIPCWFPFLYQKPETVFDFSSFDQAGPESNQKKHLHCLGRITSPTEAFPMASPDRSIDHTRTLALRLVPCEAPCHAPAPAPQLRELCWGAGCRRSALGTRPCRPCATWPGSPPLAGEMFQPKNICA